MNEHTARHHGARRLILPGLLAAAGFALSAVPPDSMGLEVEGDLRFMLRQLGGVTGWLALAWMLGRLADLLLLRAARLARRSAPFPRLLSDLLRILIFTTAGIG